VQGMKPGAITTTSRGDASSLGRVSTSSTTARGTSTAGGGGSTDVDVYSPTLAISRNASRFAMAPSLSPCDWVQRYKLHLESKF
jgi:hypothetical protein